MCPTVLFLIYAIPNVARIVVQFRQTADFKLSSSDKSKLVVFLSQKSECTRRILFVK